MYNADGEEEPLMYKSMAELVQMLAKSKTDCTKAEKILQKAREKVRGRPSQTERKDIEARKEVYDVKVAEFLKIESVIDKKTPVD